MGLNLHHVCIETKKCLKMCLQLGNRCDQVIFCLHGHLICYVVLLRPIPCVDFLALGQLVIGCTKLP